MLIRCVLCLFTVANAAKIHVHVDRTADHVVQKALELQQQEESILITRKQKNVDKLVKDFKSLAPPMLGAHKAPLSRPATVRNCRIINKIVTYARFLNLDLSISQFLHTTTARLHNVQCPFIPVSCPLMAGPYRTYDGRCNNRIQPLWGAAYTPYMREVEPLYESEEKTGSYSKTDLPRRHGAGGFPLPNARVISNIVHSNSQTPIGTPVTALYTTLGQSVSHDMADTPMERGVGGARLGCCDQTDATDRCFNIEIPPVDFFRLYGRACMGLARSVEITDLKCESGRREQMNIASAFLDLTQLYGHTAEHAQMLRGEDGLLKTSVPKSLPYQMHPNVKAFQMGINILLAGDEKVGEVPGLTGINSLLLREHNRIATKLMEMKMNSRMGSFADKPEAIYQTTRRILIAVMQNIVYAEYLPITIGRERMLKYDLYPQKTGFYAGYDPSVDPSMSNVVGAAAMRFGHSMVRNTHSLRDENYHNTSSLRLKNIFWRSNFYTKNEDPFQRGVLADDSEKCDRHLALDLRNHMFETKLGNGLDLAALNIQRGRDHGLPPYNAYRRLVNLTPPSDWSVQQFQHMSAEVVNKLSSVYRTPEDIDVWTGGVSETPVKGGQVGPLFAEILGRQFQRLRRGDYYWFENESNGLTEAQLKEIRGYSLSKMFCNNYPVETIQPRALLLPSEEGNGRVLCSSLADLNLDLW